MGSLLGGDAEMACEELRRDAEGEETSPPDVGGDEDTTGAVTVEEVASFEMLGARTRSPVLRLTRIVPLDDVLRGRS